METEPHNGTMGSMETEICPPESISCSPVPFGDGNN